MSLSVIRKARAMWFQAFIQCCLERRMWRNYSPPKGAVRHVEVK